MTRVRVEEADVSGTPGALSVQSLRDVVRDLERQRRLSGLVLTGALVGMVAFFRWLNTGPYAGNSVYFALVVLVLGVRGADDQIAKALTRLASLLADRDARPATRNPT
jgi:hypothetical protein